jgi:hypothetical protein
METPNLSKFAGSEGSREPKILRTDLVIRDSEGIYVGGISLLFKNELQGDFSPMDPLGIPDHQISPQGFGSFNCIVTFANIISVNNVYITQQICKCISAMLNIAFPF